MRPSNDPRANTILKLVFGIAFLAIFASNTWSMLHWSERRGVYDDLCYLRQAHLFQRFGVAGLDTDYARDDDRFFEAAVKEIQPIAWSDPAAPVCHTLLPSGKRVMQYPPGTGFLLALFPQGHQVAPLYVAASAVILALLLAALARARSTLAILVSGALGCEALYLMINPSKASYSIAPTAPVCALIGIVTVWLLFDPRRNRGLLAALLIGALVGLSINFRVINALLGAGYLAFFFFDFVIRRERTPFLQGVLCSLGMAVCALPTLVANAINLGSPFRTAYTAQDSIVPDFSFPAAHYYFSDIQGLFVLIALGWAIGLVVAVAAPASRRIGAVIALNLLANGGFFLSHPMSTQYYMMPIIALSFATLLCELVVRDREPAPDQHGPYNISRA